MKYCTYHYLPACCQWAQKSLTYLKTAKHNIYKDIEQNIIAYFYSEITARCLCHSVWIILGFNSGIHLHSFNNHNFSLEMTKFLTLDLVMASFNFWPFNFPNIVMHDKINKSQNLNVEKIYNWHWNANFCH